MNHRQRLEAVLSGAPADRPPVALWRHFPVDDQSPASLAAATLEYQEQYDFDLVKVTPASSFCIKDWGAQDEWRGASEGTRDYTQFPIRRAEDWTRLAPLDPRQGFLAAQLDCLRTIVSRLGAETPVLQTIFSPLAQAKNLAGRELLIAHLRQHPQAVHAGLAVIAETTRRFVSAALDTGLAGVFYAVQHAQYHLLSEDEFQRFGRAYDLQVLEPARPLWLNMLHLHGENVMFDLVCDYPIAVLNWHDRDAAPSLQEGQQRFPGVVCGGLRRQRTLVLGEPPQVQAEAWDAIRSTQGQRFILGTGCVTPITAPRANLLAARMSVEAFP
ncbi:MAG: uroporphyrinogen decarboxylase [Chloroflexi bacterium]|nr:uroporphyrinogen decarboxylase [Chloroflexota bacterium]